MIRPLSLFIGLRYTRTKRRNGFISFIALASMLGIALGVTVLITVLSVMNGFDEQIRKKFFALVPEVTILTRGEAISSWKEIQDNLKDIPGVLNTAPYVNGQGLLLQDGNMQAVEVIGIVPKEESKVLKLSQKMIQGNLPSLIPNSFNIVIGRDMAVKLGVSLGDQITVLTSDINSTPLGMIPRFKRFTISGIFHAGNGFGFDMSGVYINIEDAKKLFPSSQSNQGLNIKIANLYQAEHIASQIQNRLPMGYLATDWTKQYGAFFQALAMEKTMLFIILLLIVAVAVFNLVSTLVMVVNDKRADIAILRTLGATPKTIMLTFIVQGAVIGLIGTLIGCCFGLLLASNITFLTNELQQLLGVQFISSSVYFVDYLPSKISLIDVIEVCLIAFGLSLFATIYPALIAFKTQPAEALRYE